MNSTSVIPISSPAPAPSPPALPLSVVIIAKNEEKNIVRCLRSAPFAAELLVIENDSVDRTVEEAERCGARVVSETWRGFGAQKDFAVQQARYDWILALDADEACSVELQKEICDRFAHLDPEIGYLIPRRSFHLGRWIDHGGWYPDRQLRLFHRKFSSWQTLGIHEHVRSPKQDVFLSNLLHWVFEDISDQVRTNDRYSSLQARALAARGQEFSYFRLLLRPPMKFFETYFWKRGFLDGMPGFVISIGAAYSIFLRFAKLWEEQNLKERS